MYAFHGPGLPLAILVCMLKVLKARRPAAGFRRLTDCLVLRSVAGRLQAELSEATVHAIRCT